MFLRFCAVGALGFLVDSAGTLAMTQVLHSGPLFGRLVGFLVAATLTWHLNRSYTFGSSAPSSSRLQYLTLMSFGALLNFVVYVMWIHSFGTTPAQIVFGIALGATVALSFNFLTSRHIVFRPR